MPAHEDRNLKLIKGAKPVGSSRSVSRRVVTRRVPRQLQPVEELLERLDELPVEEPTPADEPASADPEPEAEESVENEPDALARRRRMLVGCLVVVLVAALAAAGFYGRQWYVDQAVQSARQGALAAAKQTTVNFVSVSAASVDRDLQRITAGATGEFKDEFTRGQAQVRAAVVENRVESRGSVLRAALVSGDRRTAVVLVAVDATVKNVKVPEGRPSHYRIQVDMVRDQDSGAWLVSRLQFVG